MAFTKYTTSDEEIVVVPVEKVTELVDEVKPADREYVYENSDLPADKRPY